MFLCKKETKSEYSVNKQEVEIYKLEIDMEYIESDINQHHTDILKSTQADCKHRFAQTRWSVYDNYVTYECKRCKYTKKGKVVDDKRLVKRLKEIGIWENQAK